MKQETLELAVPTVAVIHPKLGALQNEVVLPGNIQAFIDSPIYARASGYLKKWYADIGARVKAGQILAEIDAPELDQQVRQAQSAVRASPGRARSGARQSSARQGQRGTRPSYRAALEQSGWPKASSRGRKTTSIRRSIRPRRPMWRLWKRPSPRLAAMLGRPRRISRVCEEMQRYKTVKAPFDGVITARNTDIGALVNAGHGRRRPGTVPHRRDSEAARLS